MCLILVYRKQTKVSDQRTDRVGRNMSSVKKPVHRRYQYTEETMQKACDSVLKGSMSQREAAKQISVPRATLQKIVSGRTEVGIRSV